MRLPAHSPQTDPKVTNIIAHPQFRRAFWRAMQDLVDGPMQSTNISAVMSNNAAALSANSITPGKSYSEILTWVANRRSYVTQQLAAVAAPFAITNASSSTQSNINLAGTAPVKIKFLRLDSRATNETVSWLTVSNWSVPYVLSIGANNITVRGFDRFTNSIATNSITITY